jgi:hypothetical protein
VLPTVAVQGDAAALAPPRDAHVVEGLGPDPLREGLLADGKQRGTAPLALLAHDMHAPLVLDAGGIRARPAQMVAVEVGQAVVVALAEVDQLAPAKPEAQPAHTPLLARAMVAAVSCLQTSPAGGMSPQVQTPPARSTR